MNGLGSSARGLYWASLAWQVLVGGVSSLLH